MECVQDVSDADDGAAAGAEDAGAGAGAAAGVESEAAGA